MIILHISGIPGSGKSTLGDKLILNFSARNELRVIDTDSLIQRNTPNGDELLELEKFSYEDYDKRWREIFSGEIKKQIEKAQIEQIRVLVFVGILDHFGHGKSPIEIHDATYRFYIKIATPQLLFQFYTRYAKLFLNEDTFWSDLAEGREYIPSSTQYIDDEKRAKQWHIDHGYLPISIDDIYYKINNIVYEL